MKADLDDSPWWGSAKNRKESFIWPPKPGLLLFNRLGFITLKLRQDWTGEEWRAYAEFLEDSGRYQNSILLEAKRKLSRKKSTPEKKLVEVYPSSGGLLSQVKPKPKRGRKPGSIYESIALAAIKLKQEAGGRISDKEAAIKAIGGSTWRAEQQSKQVTREMTRIRRRTGTQLRKHKK